MKRFGVVLGLVAALAVASSGGVAQATTDQNAVATVVSGSDSMGAGEVSSIVGSDWAGSVEAQQGGLSAPGTVSGSDRRKHCYGAVYWKEGLNVAHIVVWKEWNHTGWCGVPFDHVIASSVGGYTTFYTGPAWSGSGRDWVKNPDRHSNNAYWTRGDVDFQECFQLCVGGGTVSTHMHIFAAGGWIGS